MKLGGHPSVVVTRRVVDFQDYKHQDMTESVNATLSFCCVGGISHHCSTPTGWQKNNFGGAAEIEVKWATLLLFSFTIIVDRPPSPIANLFFSDYRADEGPTCLCIGQCAFPDVVRLGVKMPFSWLSFLWMYVYRWLLLDSSASVHHKLLTASVHCYNCMRCS